MSLDVTVKRALFVVATLWTAFHLFGLAAFTFGDYGAPLAAALILDTVGLAVAGLFKLSRRLFPDEPTTKEQP